MTELTLTKYGKVIENKMEWGSWPVYFTSRCSHTMCKTPKYDGHSQAWWSHQSPMAYAKVRWYVADTDAKVW